jgi:hypothetical protein
MEPWGPVGWGTVGVATVFVVAAGYSVIALILASGAARRARAMLDEALSRPPITKLNPLAVQFNDLIINPNDLFIPYSPILDGKRFSDCHFIGPGVIVFLSRCETIGGSTLGCNNIVINEDYQINGVVCFVSTRFERCTFVNITFLMNRDTARRMAAANISGQKASFIGYDPYQVTAPSTVVSPSPSPPPGR